MTPRTTTHGMVGMYAKYGCRCDRCKEAYRIWRAAYRARKRKRTGSGIYSALATSRKAGP